MMRRTFPFLAGLADEAEYQLRFAVITKASGTEIRYFRSPADAEGVIMRLTPRERELLAFALAQNGFHPIAREPDAPDLQMRLELGVAA